MSEQENSLFSGILRCDCDLPQDKCSIYYAMQFLLCNATFFM